MATVGGEKRPYTGTCMIAASFAAHLDAYLNWFRQKLSGVRGGGPNLRAPGEGAGSKS